MADIKRESFEKERKRLDDLWSGRTQHHRDFLCNFGFPIALPERRFHGAVWGTLSADIQARLKPFVQEGQSQAVLLGPPGTGKTWAAWATAYMTLLRPASTVFVKFSRLLHLFSQLSFYGALGEQARELIYQYTACDVLLIDDFGLSRASDQQYQGLFDLVDGRHEKYLQTMITTSKPVEELTNTLGEALVSRLFSGLVIEFNGADRRLARPVNQTS